MGVTVFTTCFGTYGRFLSGWCDAALRSGANDILVVSDVERDVPDGVRVVVASTDATYVESGFRNVACREGREDWLWQIDVDDRIRPDACSLLGDVDADVVQVGYQRSDGIVYVPQVVPNDVFLSHAHNSYVSGSPFLRSLTATVQFPDVALSDWGFWRLAARAGARFEAAGRVAYDYRWEPYDSLTGVYQDRAHVADALAL